MFALAPTLAAVLTGAAPPAQQTSALQIIHREAKASAALMKQPLVLRFLETAQELPAIPQRTLYHDRDKTQFWTQAERDALPKTQQTGLTTYAADEQHYYTTRYGSPISYSRPLELLASQGLADVRGKKILDFGYGYVSHLRMLALLGADVHGVDVDPMLRALYAQPGDQGAVKNNSGAEGRITLHHGFYPADEKLAREVGTGYDLIISKNVLKRGYIHPEREANPKHLIKLGVSDEKFLAAFAAALKPGGRVLVYNLCPAPAPADQPYIPWADGRSPFSRAQWETAGFKVLAFDVNDDAQIRALAHALEWDKPDGDDPAMNLETGLFAWYSLFEKK